MAVSKEEVIWCHRLLLGREPESESVINTYADLLDRKTLVQTIMGSEEFIRTQSYNLPTNRPRLSASSKSTPVEREFQSRYSKEELIDLIKSHVWFHSIDFGDGIVAPGSKTLEVLKSEADAFFNPIILSARSFLDVGAWNGYFSFEAKRRGAESVLATDSYCWRDSQIRGLETFLIGCRQFGVDIETRTVPVEDLDREISPRDITLFAGVFYHLIDPIRAIESLSQVTSELLILETHQDALDLDRPAMILYPGSELCNDASNWWGPNTRCVEALLRTFGFEAVFYRDDPYYGRVRGIFHAFKSYSAVESIAPGITDSSIDLSSKSAWANYLSTGRES